MFQDYKYHSFFSNRKNKCEIPKYINQAPYSTVRNEGVIAHEHAYLSFV